MKNEILLSNIRELCKKNSITIVTLEKNLGIGAGTISRWNKATPSFDKIEAIADFFQISIDELSGHRIVPNNTNNKQIDKTTQMIIEFLISESQSGNKQIIWVDYNSSLTKGNLLVDDMQGFRSDINKLFYAYNEDGYYLLEVIYEMNSDFDYTTSLRLYLVPDEKTKPILECDDTAALRRLYINIMKEEKELEIQMKTEEKVQHQREQILKKYMESIQN